MDGCKQLIMYNCLTVKYNFNNNKKKKMEQGYNKRLQIQYVPPTITSTQEMNGLSDKIYLEDAEQWILYLTD
jgi:hypothetical protein